MRCTHSSAFLIFSQVDKAHSFSFQGNVSEWTIFHLCNRIFLGGVLIRLETALVQSYYLSHDSNYLAFPDSFFFRFFPTLAFFSSSSLALISLCETLIKPSKSFSNPSHSLFSFGFNLISLFLARRQSNLSLRKHQS